MVNQTVLQRLQNIRVKQPWLVMSAKEKFLLSESSNPAISHFYRFEVSQQSPDTIAIPDGCVDIVIECNADSPTAEIYGTPMEAMKVGFKPQHQYFGVRFLSGIMPDCLNISAQELIEHHYDLNDVIPKANQLVERLAQERDFQQQVALCQRFFNDKQSRVLSPLTQCVVSQIFEHRGNIRIDQLAELTGYSTRTIQRLFKADLGMTPKAFGRIVRCQSAVYQINHNQALGFSDLAFDLGFTDQPHFMKEFKKLVNSTPMAYQTKVKHETYLQRIQYF